MTPNISVERYKSMGFGHDLTNVPDEELWALIQGASAEVDTFTAAPQLPQPHSFAGGALTKEQHRWTLGTDTVWGSRRVYPWHTPIKSVQNFSIQVTNQISVGIGPTDVYINNSEGYLEVISLAAVTFGIFPVGVWPNLGLLQPVANVDYTYGYDFPVAKEPLYSTDGLLFRAANGYIDAASVNVYENGATVSGGSYALDTFDGSIHFAAAPSGAITMDYHYTMPAAVARATGEIVTERLAERAITARGMRGLAAIEIAELSVRRSFRGSVAQAGLSDAVPATAALLLEPYRFRSVR